MGCYNPLAAFGDKGLITCVCTSSLYLNTFQNNHTGKPQLIVTLLQDFEALKRVPYHSTTYVATEGSGSNITFTILNVCLQ